MMNCMICTSQPWPLTIFFSQGPYEISKDMLESSPIASPAALEVAISFAAEKSKLLPRYR